MQTMERFHISIQAYLSSQDPFGTFFWNVQNVRKNTSQHIYTDILLFEKMVSLKKNLPKKLIICMDNTSSENKNYIYFKWALLLLVLGVFNEIQWIFLPVGHTHFVNDQVFSKFARELLNVLGGIKELEDFYKVSCIKKKTFVL
jgi:hypothetical protein